MFKLVGDDIFTLDDMKCVIRVNIYILRQYLLKCLSIGIIICISKVDPLSGFKYKYSLVVDGKPYEQFKENQAKAMKTWETVVNSSAYRIVLGSTAFPLFF